MCLLEFWGTTPGYTHICVDRRGHHRCRIVVPWTKKCATTFPSPAMLAASFNESIWHMKGEAISTEVRALNNVHGHRGCGPPAMIGIKWGPNINLMRDPRFGRNSELPSEDPLLTGKYAAQYVRGLQEGPDPKYVKVLATHKHYTAYSVENHARIMLLAYSFAGWIFWDHHHHQMCQVREASACT